MVNGRQQIKNLSEFNTKQKDGEENIKNIQDEAQKVRANKYVHRENQGLAGREIEHTTQKEKAKMRNRKLAADTINININFVVPTGANLEGSSRPVPL